MDGMAIVATMADNDMTQGSNSPFVSILLDQIEDPDAPQIFSFDPLTQPQNLVAISMIRMDFGADEVTTELPFAVELHNAATGALEFTFGPCTTGPVETVAPTPPDLAGEYTLCRVAGNPDFTTIITVKVDASALPSPDIDYVWRISEDVAGFELKSSLRKPGDVLDIVGPELFDMNTWPEDEFYNNDDRQPYLYFVPRDPLIRRNPLGMREPPPADPPAFVPDDPTAYLDLVKSTGDEFMIIFGSAGPPPIPDSPMVYYSYGLDPPEDIASADGEIPISSRQPHLLAGLAAVVDGAPGDVSFGLFSKEGTFLGGVSRILATMQITRSAAMQVDGDFGVRPGVPPAT